MHCNALTICQPYAELIVRGKKRVENRSRRISYYRSLLIHAGKSRTWMEPGDAKRYPEMAFGALVGFCWAGPCYSLAEIARGDVLEDLRWVRKHAHTEGPFCLVLRNVRRFVEPIPYTGQRGLFRVEITEVLERAMRGAQPVEPQANGPAQLGV